MTTETTPVAGESVFPRVERRRPRPLPESHLASIVFDAVEQLGPIEERVWPAFAGAVTGGPLDTADGRRLTALLVYGLSHGAASSRAIERATQEDPAMAWIAARPRTHDELRAFRRAHRVALVNVFVDVFRLCETAGLVKVGQIALDTVRLPAEGADPNTVAGLRVARTATALAEEAESLLQRSEEEDREDDVLFGAAQGELSIPPELERHESRVTRLRAARLELEASLQAGRDRRETSNLVGELALWGVDAYVGEGRPRAVRVTPPRGRTLADLELHDWDHDRDEDEWWPAMRTDPPPAPHGPISRR